MRDQQIREWLASLESSFGEPQPLADVQELALLHASQDYRGMLRVIKTKLRLTMRLRLGLVNSGGRRSAPAWVEYCGPVPMYGTQAFERFVVTVYIRRKFLREVSFGGTVVAMAHELAHVVLSSTYHSLRKVEEAVDLTAMLLGFREFYTKDAVSETEKKVELRWFHRKELVTAIRAGRLPRNRTVRILITKSIGYLSLEEIRYAARLMQT